MVLKMGWDLARCLKQMEQLEQGKRNMKMQDLAKKKYPVIPYGCTFLSWLQRQNKTGKVKSGQITESLGSQSERWEDHLFSHFRNINIECDYAPNTIPSA